MARKKQQKSTTAHPLIGPRYSREEMLQVMRGKRSEPPSVFIEAAGCEGHSGRFSADKWVEHKWEQGELQHTMEKSSRKIPASKSEVRQKGEHCESGSNTEVGDATKDVLRDRMRALLSRPSARQQGAGKIVTPLVVKPSSSLGYGMATSVPSAFGYQQVRPQVINPVGGGVPMASPAPSYFNYPLAPTSPCVPSSYPYYHPGYPYLAQAPQGYPQATAVPTPSYLTSSLPSGYYPQQPQQLPASTFAFPGIPQPSWSALQQGQVAQQMPVVQPMKRIKPATAEDYHRRGNLRYSTSEYGDERLPEWVEGGPKNTDETVELRGFEEESDKGSHEPEGGVKQRAVEDDESDVMEFASKVLNVALDPPPLQVEEKQAPQKPVTFSRMSRFFTSYKTPERKDPSDDAREGGEVQKSAVRRLAQSGDEGLTKVDRPTATPPVLRQLFASAKKDQLENAAMPSLGEGVKVDELERKLIAQSTPSHQSSQSQSMMSTPSKLLPPPLQVPSLTAEDVRSTRAQLQYGWSPKKRVSAGNATSPIPAYAQPSSFPYPPAAPTQRYAGSLPTGGGVFMPQGGPNVHPQVAAYQQPYSPSPYSMRAPVYPTAVQMPGQYAVPSMQQVPVYPQQPSAVAQPTNQQVTQMLSANPTLRAEFVDFITRKIQAYQAGNIQESHLGMQAILSGVVGQQEDVSSQNLNASSAGQGGAHLGAALSGCMTVSGSLVPTASAAPSVPTGMPAAVSSTSNAGVADADAQKIVDQMINMKL